MRLTTRCIATACVVLGGLVAPRTTATGLMLPKAEGMPPLAILYQRIEVAVDNQVARTTVRQAFQNSTDRPLEATYVFPLPKGASVTEFAMTINGKRVTGELLEKDKARQIYQDIVRRMRDPGLLEYLGGNLFQASVFPIPPRGRQEVEFAYAEVVPREMGICRYTYPLRTGEQASRTLEDLSLSVRLRSREPIRTVYSPSHQLDVVRKGDFEATAGFEGLGQPLDTDFGLYWTVSDKDVGINLLARRQKGQDGFFLLLLSPKAEPQAGEIASKDVVFVLDTSGSMSSNGKLDQAKAALRYCVSSLRDGDRFDIVRFSTDVERFQPALVSRAPDTVKQALEFVDRFPARGGTDIHSALASALALQTPESRQFVVVFLTDGQPTVGTTDAKAIQAMARTTAAGRARLFCFGVGFDVNTHLLDGLAEDTRAATEYVRPEENIEVKVSLFFNKVGEPVLTSPTLDFGQAQVVDVYPRQLPDVFAGTQLLVLGRYRGAGPTAIRLRGEVNGKAREFVDEATFADASDGNPFIERLWGTRKVGFLLDEIRLHGESAELKDEVVRLSREYGIVTPYTSYLVVEDTPPGLAGGPVPQAVPTMAPGMAPGGGGFGYGGAKREVGARVMSAPGVADRLARAAGLPAPVAEPAAGMPGGRPTGGAADSDAAYGLGVPAMRQEVTGAGAVRLSESLAGMKASVVATPSAPGEVRSVAGRVFHRVGGVWIDQTFTAGGEVLHIRYASTAYFRLLELRPDLMSCLTLGDKLIVALTPRLALRIDDDGQDSLTVADEARLKRD